MISLLQGHIGGFLQPIPADLPKATDRSHTRVVPKEEQCRYVKETLKAPKTSRGSTKPDGRPDAEPEFGAMDRLGNADETYKNPAPP